MSTTYRYANFNTPHAKLALLTVLFYVFELENKSLSFLQNNLFQKFNDPAFSDKPVDICVLSHL